MNELGHQPENGDFFETPNGPEEYGAPIEEQQGISEGAEVDTSSVTGAPSRGLRPELPLDTDAYTFVGETEHSEQNAAAAGSLAVAGSVETEPDYTDRLEVPADRKDWSADWPDYDPPAFTTEKVRIAGVEKGVSDPESPAEVDFSERPSFMGEYGFDERGRPLNPTGRQGLADRGDLSKWGPNNAADPVVVASDPETSDRKILLVRRGDTGTWALPGGKVNPGEQVSRTAVRELEEEAGIDLREVEAEVVYEGYVDDPRNTDNAWFETTARLFRLNYVPQPTAGSDAAEARWFGCNSINQLRAEIRTLDALQETMEPLYASHSQIIEEALRRF
jgi:ADP-ribose pyrophosphatase